MNPLCSCDNNEIMRGEAFNQGFYVTTKEGNPVTDEDVENVEISLAGQTKTYLNGQVEYEGEGVWSYPITQAQSFAFPPRVRAQIRVKFKSEKNELVLGRKVVDFMVVDSDSKEEL